MAERTNKAETGLSAGLPDALVAEIRKANGWVEIESYDDLPEQTGLSYVFEYKAGGTWVWDLAVGPMGANLYGSLMARVSGRTRTN
jgi:hypothetical protein